jgi:hypothetical protein
MNAPERLSAGNLTELLEKTAPAIAAGSVNVMSVAAIQERFGDRWERRREQVEAFIERNFARASSPDAWIMALNDAEFVTVQPGLSRVAALSLSANVLKETLRFFIGAAAPDTVRLFQVTGFAGGELSVEPVDYAGLADPLESAGCSSIGSAGEQVWAAMSALSTTVIASPRQSGQIIPSNGPELRTVTAVAPVWNLRARAMTSFLVATEAFRVLPDGTLAAAPVSQLSSNVAAGLSLQGLTYAEERIRSGGEAGNPVALHLPLPLNALSYSAPRYRLLHALRRLDRDVRRYLLLELTELPAGLPQSRLTELVSMLSPFARAIVARAPSEMADVGGWRRCGLNGVSLNCRRFDPGDRRIATRLSAFARRVLDIAPACIGYELQARSLMLGAWAGGFTHLSSPVVSARSPGLAAARLHPPDLYASTQSA